MDPRIAYYNNQYACQLPTSTRMNYFQLYLKNSNFAAVKFILENCIKLEGL